MPSERRPPRRAPRSTQVPAVLAALVAVVGLVGACSSGSSRPAATSSAAAPYLDGDVTRLPLTGPTNLPIHWELLPSATADQQAVQLALQRFESLAAAIAVTGPSFAYQPLLQALTTIPGAADRPIGGTPADYRGNGVLWERVYSVYIDPSDLDPADLDPARGALGSAVTVTCTDQRTIGDLTPSAGVGLGRTREVVPVAYRWRRIAGSWHLQSRLTSAPGGPAANPDCRTWPDSHTRWTGPS